MYDEKKDGRRGRKRTLDELYAKVEALDTVLDSIRSTDDRSLGDLIRLIRSEASIDEVAAHARSIIQTERRSESNERARNVVMSIASLTDEPTIRVPAKPWVTLKNVDDDFVSHMMSVYFTWHHESYPCVHKETFVEAMKSQDLNSSYCSPFLVNCMLLTACVSATSKTPPNY